MASFYYRAIDGQGKEQSGVIEAGDAREAALQLRARSLHVVRVGEGAAPSGASAWLLSLPSRIRDIRPADIGAVLPVTANDRALFFRQLALMIRSGHTVVDALDIAGPLARKRGLRKALAGTTEGIRGGTSLSRAMERHARIFPPLATRLVACGEESGELDTVLDRIADDYERNIEIRRDLFRATLYPAIVFILAVALTFVLLRYVVPSYASFFAARRLQMPWLLQNFVDLSDWLGAYGVTLAWMGGLAVFLVLAAYTTQRGKAVIDRVLLRTPIFGYPMVMAAMARFCNTMAILLRSGLTVVEGLRVTGRVTGNALLARGFRHAEQEIVRGRNLTDSLNQPGIPELLRRMTSVGEYSGELDRVLEETGRYYDGMLSARVKLMVAWLEPALIVVVGGVVGVIYYAIFQAALRAASGGVANI